MSGPYQVDLKAMSGPYQVDLKAMSGPGSDGNEGVLHIPQSSSITGTLPSDCLAPYTGHSLRESYPSAEMQSP